MRCHQHRLSLRVVHHFSTNHYPLLILSQRTLLKVDANDFTPHANTPVVTGPPFAPKKEQISPADMCKSEQHVTVKQEVMPTPQSPPQPSHTQLEEVLLQTLPLTH